ncbi:MAG: hypothetical protein IPK82_13070 [Polyangiaceae bacterium]|nr:hypothetical protein [Polyangiaceae bacterium]
MIHKVDDQLRREALVYALRFACPDCASFNEEEQTCSLGFPVEDHKDAQITERSHVVFCKTFELR